MRIDIHAHTSNHPMRGLHTTDASLNALEREADHYGFDLVMLLATYFPLKGTGLPNAELLRRIAGRKRFAMFGSLDVSNNFAAGLVELTELAERQMLAGIKLYPGYQDFDCSSRLLWPLYQMAQRYHLPVAVHTGELHHCCPQELRERGEAKCGFVCPLDSRGHQTHPRTVREAALSFPKVNFILCHLGNPDFVAARSLMLECPNVFADISGQFLSGTDEASPRYKAEIRKEISLFLELPAGNSRVLFGTDFPIQSYADSVELIEQLGLDAISKRNIYGDNAQRLLERSH